MNLLVLDASWCKFPSMRLALSKCNVPPSSALHLRDAMHLAESHPGANGVISHCIKGIAP